MGDDTVMKRDYRNSSADAWYQEITDHPAAFPFLFTYDGVPQKGFPAETFALVSREKTERDDTQVTELLFRRDDALFIRLHCAHYPLYGATEWTVWFENRGDRDTGIVSDAQSCLRFEGRYPTLKGILGDHVNRYRPYALDVTAVPRYFESNRGPATHVYFPYFNLEYGDGGVMLAIGWAGTWRADFRYDAQSGATEYRARSVNRLHTRLRPGETIRTALFVCAPYTVRNENFAANYWRSWFVRHNLPHADRSGTPLEPFSTTGLSGDTGLPNSDGSISERYFTWRPSMEKMIAEGVKVDFRWFDAGWYIAPDGSSPESDWWGTVGTWTLDPVKWPDGTFRESTDFARAHGMKTLMWFEPERVTDPENLAAHYGYDVSWAIRGKDNVISNNIGNPACLRWTLDRIEHTLTENRVELYREDNNSYQAALWNDFDRQEGLDRCGITESKFIDAHYRMWDEIIACTLSYGGCGFVDSCASGGGRNDLESLRRGVPLLRSDHDRTAIATRLSMTTAFNRWIPFCGAINREQGSELAPSGVLDRYVWRASYLPALNVSSQYVQDPDQDFDMLRAGLREWNRLKRYLLQEFYVLTPWHTEDELTGFTAYCFYDPKEKAGVLLAFRQEYCEEAALPITLPFIEPEAACVLTDEDSGEIIRLTGEVMQARGFELTFDAPRSARLLWVREE